MRKGWFGTCFYTSCQRVCTQGSGGRFRYELGEYALQRVRSGHVFCHQYHAIDEIRANVGEFRYVAFWNAHSRACHTYIGISISMCIYLVCTYISICIPTWLSTLSPHPTTTPNKSSRFSAAPCWSAAVACARRSCWRHKRLPTGRACSASKETSVGE